MLRTVATKSAYVLAGTAVVGGSSITAYTYTEQGKGLKRQMQFWYNLAPIVSDYFFQTSSYSPYVKLEKKLYYNDENGVGVYAAKRKELLNELHHKHAPELLGILQKLKGLYVKLGQVLSVSAIPLPQVYKKELRVLQSDVPGYEDYETIIKSIIEKEMGKPIEDIFDVVEAVPCGAASIGQAHRARLKGNRDGDHKSGEKLTESKSSDDFDVVIKVQYPHASWQVPADIECIGQFLKMCVFFDIVDKTSAELSYEEFARQFLSELDYQSETGNLKLIHESSLDPNAPYLNRNVIVPKVYEDLCSKKVITMEYIPGPKIEEEARKQLELMGLKTNRSVKEIVKDTENEVSMAEGKDIYFEEIERDSDLIVQKEHPGGRGVVEKKLKRETLVDLKSKALKLAGQMIGIDNIFLILRTIRQIIFLSQASAIRLIQSTPGAMVPLSWHEWADQNAKFVSQAATLNLTKEWIDSLFDVHGHQIFSLGCFNADCHPGNILVVASKDGLPTKRLGLIDFGQCKKLTSEEQISIAKLILSVANKEPDHIIADTFRDMGIKTENDSTEFLAHFTKLMFGPLKAEYMDRKWHVALHKMDKVVYFPKELSMVYRTSLLLRGLSLSLQMNCSISEQWKPHAEAVVDGLQV
jgi:aarF domain-containing kinase